MKLNIGSGYKKIPGFVTVDADPNCNPDILMNLDDINIKFDIPDNTVTHVIAHHILEHIGAGYIPLLKELYRICAPGAIIDIRVPHPRHEIFLNDPTHVRPIMVEGFRLFSKAHNRAEIANGGSSSTLGLMYDVDFVIVAYDYVHDPFYTAIVQQNTPEQNQRLFREALNTTLETHIVLSVNKS